jgi:hypothetical protein
MRPQGHGRKRQTSPACFFQFFKSTRNPYAPELKSSAYLLWGRWGYTIENVKQVLYRNSTSCWKECPRLITTQLHRGLSGKGIFHGSTGSFQTSSLPSCLALLLSYIGFGSLCFNRMGFCYTMAHSALAWRHTHGSEYCPVIFTAWGLRLDTNLFFKEFTGFYIL